MRKLRFTRTARGDLKAIFRYGLTHFGRENTRDFFTKFDRAFAYLCEFDLGERCDDVAPGLFRYAVGHYVVFFSRSVTHVRIVRVLHGSQSLAGKF